MHTMYQKIGSMKNVDAQFPPKMIDSLFHTKARYRTWFGGRGGSKSWSIARALLIKGVNDPLRILCAREYMSSVHDSVHRLLADQIIALGLQDFYTVEKAQIFAPNGTEFRFAGIRNNVMTIKSFEGIDIAFCEEAQNITDNSWNVLIPTIRKKNSEIWICFNPELATDPTYKRFVLNPPPDSIVTKINFDDNPFFPEVLKAEAEYLKATDPDAYANVWLGFPKTILSNAIYGKELRAATEENRITKLPYDPSVCVHTFWDLGMADDTSIILAQIVGHEYHIIDYVTGNGMAVGEYLRILKEKPYIYGTDFLPHDARAREKGSGRSIEEMMRSLGRTVKIVPMLRIADGINAARTIFPRLYFDESKCFDLLQALRKYCYDIPRSVFGQAPKITINPKPVHNDASHGADSFRYMALALRAPKGKPPGVRLPSPSESPHGWMS